MDGTTVTSANPFPAPPRPDAPRSSADDTLRPEFAVLRKRFDDWARELRNLSLWQPSPDVVGEALDGPIRHLRHIAETIDDELRRSREPEDLRRLLSHGQRLTGQLAVRRAGLDEARRLIVSLAGVCERLMLEPRVDDETLPDLLQSLRQTAVDGDHHLWVLWDPALNDVSSAALDAVRKRWRDAVAQIVSVGVPSARLAARVAQRLGFGSRETAAALFASLLQDCGYLLLEQRRGAAFAEHPRYGAVLSAGLKRIPTETLAAIAGHHALPLDPRRADGVVAVVSRYVESVLHEGTLPVFDEVSPGGFLGDVVAALHAELSRVVLPVSVESAEDASVPDESQSRETISPPHFHVVRNSFRTSPCRAKCPSSIE